MLSESSPPAQSQPPPSGYMIKILPPPGPSVSSLYDSCSPATPQIFSDAMTIRLQVFCTEQGCSAANELDEDDQRSWHWVTYDTSSDKPIACTRLVPPPHAPHPNGCENPEEKPYVKLTRLAVFPEARGKGLAKVLCEEAVGWAARNKEGIGGGWDGLVLVHAQVGVEKMWARLGFKTDERLGRWDEEGIEHLGMWRELDLTAPKIG
ncbi:hypothetical protein GJ744_011051 [Endocarpon pusillum]|uniref:N-acetyltransferase domain-containing protein n=1 Tax=Endocarpon pusillum TaxID=364733 RepID=A0A8H7E2J2_9EURO|nr:hypothetical protein GJ744_011051 [Endocarpon pusillum]